MRETDTLLAVFLCLIFVVSVTSLQVFIENRKARRPMLFVAAVIGGFVLIGRLLYQALYAG